MHLLKKISHLAERIGFVRRLDQKAIDRLFVWVFSTEDGEQVLAYLHYITTSRTVSPTVADEQLRMMQGERSMVQMIQKIVDRGRSSP